MSKLWRIFESKRRQFDGSDSVLTSEQIDYPSPHGIFWAALVVLTESEIWIKI